MWLANRAIVTGDRIVRLSCALTESSQRSSTEAHCYRFYDARVHSRDDQFSRSGNEKNASGGAAELTLMTRADVREWTTRQ